MTDSMSDSGDERPSVVDKYTTLLIFKPNAVAQNCKHGQAILRLYTKLEHLEMGHERRGQTLATKPRWQT